MNMDFQDLIEKCHNTGYKKLTFGKKPLRRCGMLKKVKRRFKGFRLMTARKLKWRSFWIAMMPLRRTLSVCYNMLNQLKVDGAYPAIVFSSQWGLPVLAHPTSKCRNPRVSIYRKPVNNVEFA